MNSNPLTSNQSIAQTHPHAAVAAAAASYGGKLRRVAIIVGLLIALGAAAGLLPRWKHRIAVIERSHELAVRNVTIVSPTPGKAVPGLVLPAEVKALVEAPIYARASGYLKRRMVDIGSRVKEGDLLAEIDTPEIEQQLSEARAQLAQAKAAETLARSTAERWAGLLSSEGVSKQEADEKKADAELKSANVAAAQAHINQLKDMVAFSVVTAPFSGTITSRGTDVGQLITANGSKALFCLAQTAKLRVFTHVPQSAARTIQVGQMADLMLPELPDRTFPAKVVRTSGAVSTDSRTLLVELEVDNAKEEIFSGAYAQVRFIDAHANAALTLPSNTLLFRSEGLQVGIVGDDGKVELRNVTLGRDFGQTVEILSGADPKDRVILNPSDSLVNGTPVRATEASLKPAGG